MAKFQVLAGKHYVSLEPLHVARQGDVVESDRDLVEVFGSEKFRRVEEAPQVADARVEDDKADAAKTKGKKAASPEQDK